MSIYVAGSSHPIELARAKRIIAMLRERNIEVTSTWPEVVERHGGVGNPRDLDRDACRMIALNCLAEVGQAYAFWMLCPGEGRSSHGAYFEAASFAGSGLRVASGDYRQSIFTALSTICYDTDDEAFAELVTLYERNRRAP